MRERGAKIGKNVMIFDPKSTLLDVTRPYMIEIGNNVQITRGVIILTHGYEWSVLKNVYGDILGSCGKVSIGNNVFIGMNTIILKGVNIGNNVIIGAGSVVTHNLNDNSVYTGNPAKFVMTLDEYYEKRKSAQIIEAKEQVLQYQTRVMNKPDKMVLREFFFLFEDINDDKEIFSEYKRMLGFTDNYEDSLNKFIKTRMNRPFYDIDAFINFCNGDKYYKGKVEDKI
ncbi:MAG: acyltransferase [Clostridium cadaveris]|uniref:Acyltransferase n=1 Tax=Clostridium cadaveris TaxID=1529 RepID=A0A316MC07_9CLOT|nr:MAG: acyltransferase [Clostridium cadaveris]